MTNYFAGQDYFDYLEFPIRITFSNTDSHLLHSLGSSKAIKVKAIYFVMFILNFLLNDLVLLIILIICDLILLVQLKSKLKIKQKFYLNEKNSKSTETKVKKIENTEFKIILTVFLNSTILILFRIAEFSISIFVFVLRLNGISCSFFNKICSNFIQFSNIFYLITCSNTILVYYFLNKTFRSILNKYLHSSHKIILKN